MIKKLKNLIKKLKLPASIKIKSKNQRINLYNQKIKKIKHRLKIKIYNKKSEVLQNYQTINNQELIKSQILIICQETIIINLCLSMQRNLF